MANPPILNISDSLTINLDNKHEKNSRKRDIEEGVRLTPGLDPNHLSTSPIAEPVLFESTLGGTGSTTATSSRSIRFNSTGVNNFYASEDDQIIRRGIDQLHFTLPINSPLLKTSEAEITADYAVSRLKTPINSALLSATTQQPIHSPYIRMCAQLENFVDTETEASDTLLFNREQEYRHGSVDISPELMKAKLLFTNPNTNNNSNHQDSASNNGNSNTSTSTSTNNIESRSLWLGNVDPTVTEEEIRTLFAPFGPIETIRLLPAKECAFVNYYETLTAIRAKNELNGSQLGNMILRIGYGKINDTKTNGNNNTNDTASNTNTTTNSTASNSPDSRSIWIGNVGPDVSTDLLLFHFSQFGPIESCRILEAKNCAFINFYSPEVAVMARIKMNGAQIGSLMIKTGFAKDSNNNNSEKERERDIHYNNNNNINAAVTFASVTTKLITTTEKTSSNANKNKNLMDIDNLREMRRKVEASGEEIPNILEELIGELDKVAVDSYGNILLQKIIERATEADQLKMVHKLSQVIPQVAMNKNGTWVIQKFITAGRSEGVQIETIKCFIEHVCEMLEDQFGNYVIQCALNMNVSVNDTNDNNDFSSGSVINTQIQMIVDSIIKNIRKLSCGRFSSRALKSILDSSTPSRQKQFSQAIAKEAVFLSVDPNGVVVIQWILDSDLAGKINLITTQLQGRLAQVALTKSGSGIIARIVGNQEETAIRDAAISELYELIDTEFNNTFNTNNNAHLDELLSEPSTCSILLKAFQMSKPAIRIKLSTKLTPKLQEIITNTNTKNTANANGSSQSDSAEPNIPVHLLKLYNEILIKK